MKEQINSIRKEIKNINSYFYDLFTYELRETNLTVPQVIVLRCIKEQPQMISSISDSVRLSNSTVSGIIDRLEKNGYVTRIRDLKDRRIVWVKETEKLVQLREKLPMLHDDYFEFLFEDLDSNSIKEILQSLKILSEHLEQKIKDYKNE